MTARADEQNAALARLDKGLFAMRDEATEALTRAVKAESAAMDLMGATVRQADFQEQCERLRLLMQGLESVVAGVASLARLCGVAPKEIEPPPTLAELIRW